MRSWDDEKVNRKGRDGRKGNQDQPQRPQGAQRKSREEALAMQRTQKGSKSIQETKFLRCPADGFLDEPNAMFLVLLSLVLSLRVKIS